VNAVCVLDEAHTIASSDDARDGDTVAAEPAQAIRHTRKCHLGFLVATQEIGALAQNVFRGLHTYIFGFGLKNASEQERVKEILADQSAWRIYEQMPDPNSSGIYQYAIQGAALPLANEQLMDDLQALVDAGLVIEVRELDQPSRYALSNPGRALATRSGGPDGHVHPIEDWPEPCPACDAREGFS
jgi:hypothetical protein